jgi:hypothetical protein
MPRSLVLMLGLALACTDARDPAPVAEPAPERTDPPMHDTPPASTESLEPLALRCDGEAIKAAFARLDPAALASVDDGPSARLLARWESTRQFATDGTIERAIVEAFVVALAAELGQQPPRWWVEQLAAAKQYEGKDPPYYDVGRTENGDRRGELVPGPGTAQVRPNMASVLTASDGKLYFDLSMGRLELGPLPTEPDATLELTRARAGSTIYWASFSRGSGGFRFPLRAIAYSKGEQWQAEVCGPDRKILGGLGYLTVEIVALEPAPDPGSKPGEMRPSSGATGIAVFTAESHGVAVEVFDPQTGARTLAWSSDFWFSR